MHEDIVECIRRNAAQLRAVWRGNQLHAGLKADGTVISHHDARIERELQRLIERVDPEAVILGEEFGTSEHRHERWHDRPIYTIDPIDGTHAFTNGGFSFAIVVERIAPNHRDEDAIIALPAYGEIIHVENRATPDGGQTIAPLFRRSSPTFVANDQILCDSKLHRDVDFRFPGKIRSFGSTAHHAVEVARGRYLAMLWQSAHPWDTLPVLALMGTVRGSVAVLGGKDVTIEDILEGRIVADDHPLVLAAGHPSVLAQLPPHFPLRAS